MTDAAKIAEAVRRAEGVEAALRKDFAGLRRIAHSRQIAPLPVLHAGLARRQKPPPTSAKPAWGESALGRAGH